MNYDFNNVMRVFQSAPYAERRERLLAMLGPEFAAQTPPVAALIDAVVYKVSQPHIMLINPGPSLFIEIGLQFGLTIGVFLERYRERERRYDLTEVVAEFMFDASEERRAVMDEMAMQAGDVATQWVLAQVETEIEEYTRHATRKFKVLKLAVSIAMRYGCALGILLEEDRVMRSQRVL